MWNPLRTEVFERFATVEMFFKATRGNGRKVEQTAKGIAFVHMYAAYEFAVKSAVRTSIDAIIAHRHLTEDLSPCLMAVFLDSDLQRLRDCPKGGIWSARIKVFERLFSGYPASTPNTTFPDDRSHFRKEQLQTIFNVLGIKRLPARRRSHLLKIDEMVNNRNAVAHGQETAAAIGSRYTRSEVLHMMNQVKSVCLTVISAAEKQCSDNQKHRREQ